MIGYGQYGNDTYSVKRGSKVLAEGLTKREAQLFGKDAAKKGEAVRPAPAKADQKFAKKRPAKAPKKR